MGLRDSLRRRAQEMRRDGGDGSGQVRLPDPAKVPTNRGPWEQAAIVNVDVTEVVKRQLGTVTPPWKK